MKLLLLQCMSPQSARLRRQPVTLGVPVSEAERTCSGKPLAAAFGPGTDIEVAARANRVRMSPDHASGHSASSGA